MWFSKKHDKIRVEFIEAGKGKPFAVSMIPIVQLPETFEIATTLDIAEKKWSVVEANPKLKSDFERSGKLQVVLTPVQMANPQDMLFSLPTINDSMCALKKATSLDGMRVTHEDDWRQIEFVSENLLSQVETEINSIKTIYETKRSGVGFTGLHVRKLVEMPIADGVMTYTAVKSHFRVVKEFGGFGISSYMAVAENSFAFDTNDGLRLYGVLNQKGNVAFLCLAGNDGFVSKCGDFLKSFHLIGVDWARCQIVRN